MKKIEVGENVTRITSRPPAQGGPAGESSVDPPFRPDIPSHEGYSESDSEPVAPTERKKKRADKDK